MTPFEMTFYDRTLVEKGVWVAVLQLISLTAYSHQKLTEGLASQSFRLQYVATGEVMASTL
jgi:uncharacterized membrane protein YiaA